MKLIFLLCFCFATKFTNAQTFGRTIVRGTGYSLIPPAGFTNATNFSGFQKADIGASIMVVEMPAPINTVLEGFTAERMKKSGMDLPGKEAIDIENVRYTLLKVRQQTNGTVYLKQILCLGNAEKTVMINGIFPESQKEIEPEILKCLFSVKTELSVDDDAVATAKFSIDVSGTQLKFAKSVMGSLIFSVDGKVPTETPTFIVTQSISNFSAPVYKIFAHNRLRQLPGGALAVIKKEGPVAIDNSRVFRLPQPAKMEKETTNYLSKPCYSPLQIISY